jgi:(2Fe-2S) ferredoxin
VLVCCTEGCCGARGGPEVFEAFWTALERHRLEEVLLSKTLCSGLCPEEKVTVIVHPDGLWYAATPKDAETIVAEHLAKGQPVARLLRPELRVGEPS